MSADIPVAKQAAGEALAAARRSRNEAIEAKALALAAVVNLHREDRPPVSKISKKPCGAPAALEDEDVLSFVLARAAFFYGEIGDIARCSSLL